MGIGENSAKKDRVKELYGGIVMDIVFVVLHYMTLEYTKKCIESIQNKIDTKKYKIIIVDNASPDKSGSVLANMYESSEYVETILLEKNCGFAQGNNVGIKWACERYQPEFVVVTNNDTELISVNLYSRLCEDYKEKQFSLLGPMICTKDGRCDINPIAERKNSKQWFEGFLRHNIRLKRLVVVNMDMVFLRILKICNAIREKRKKQQIEKKTYNITKINCELHGCCLIFSKKFFEKLSGFDSRTFMYCEETILYYACLKNNLITMYDPCIAFYHEEEAATTKSATSKKNKRKNRYNWMIDAIRILLDNYLT